MNKKHLAFLIALFLFFNAFLGTIISAESNDIQQKEFIVNLNVDLINSGYGDALRAKDLKTAKNIAEDVFKLYEQEIRKISKNIEVF